MSRRLDYLAADDMVQLTAEGQRDRADLRQLTRDAVVAGHRLRCARFLIDPRRTVLALGTAEIFDMPERGEDAGCAPIARRLPDAQPRRRLISISAEVSSSPRPRTLSSR